MARILVTGASGRIGSVLLPKLISEGHDVSILSSKLPVQMPKIANFIHVDWNNFEIPRLLNFEVVIHLAHQTSAYVAQNNPLRDAQQNIISSIRILEELKKSGKTSKFIFLGSLTEYGSRVSNPILETQRLNPETFYDVTKVSISHYLTQYFNEDSIHELFLLKIGNVYGISPNQIKVHRGFLDQSIHKATLGENLICFGDGSYLRDFIHVDDLANAILNCINLPFQKRALSMNISGGIGYSILSALQTINISLVSQNLRPVEILFANFPEQSYAIEQRSHVANINLARNLINWFPRISLNEGILNSIKSIFKLVQE